MMVHSTDAGTLGLNGLTLPSASRFRRHQLFSWPVITLGDNGRLIYYWNQAIFGFPINLAGINNVIGKYRLSN